MSDWKHALIKIPGLRRLLFFGFRAKTVVGYQAAPLANSVAWLFTSREITNFTYNLSATNRRYLASLLSIVTGTSSGQVLEFIEEIQNDTALKEHVAAAIARSPHRNQADREVAFGRRIGWYACVRATRPKVVVETGVDKGLGACVLTSALMRNNAEGHPGYYYGTDINPEAGYMLSGRYATFGEILYGDSLSLLRNLTKEVDLFINDSDHSAEYEEREYAAIESKLAPQAIVLGDNAHVTEKLLDFAIASGRKFLFFQEKPEKHWYPGGGIGIAYRESAGRPLGRGARAGYT